MCNTPNSLRKTYHTNDLSTPAARRKAKRDLKERDVDRNYQKKRKDKDKSLRSMWD